MFILFGHTFHFAIKIPPVLNMKRGVCFFMIALLIPITAILIYFLLISEPVALQKAFSISFENVPIEKKNHKYNSDISENELPVNIPEVIQEIPYQRNKNNNFGGSGISSQQRIRRTITEGYGDCSAFSFGMGALLNSKNIPFQIIDIMPYDSFLIGNGHTIISVKDTAFSRNESVLVDVLAGSIPLINNQPVSYQLLIQLSRGKKEVLSFKSLTRQPFFINPYYQDLLTKSFIGIRCYADVCRYLTYTDYIYINFCNYYLEKLIYQGISIVFGYYPLIYVSPEFEAKLLSDKKFVRERFFAHAFIYLIRVFLTLAITVPFLFVIDKWHTRMRNFTKEIT